MAQEVSHHPHFVPGLRIGSHSPCTIPVVSIHHQQQVELIKVFGSDLSRTAAEVVAVAGSMCPHAAVGQLAHVPVADAGRVHLDTVTLPLLFYQVRHDAFSGRRAADIAQADKEQFHLVFLCRLIHDCSYFYCGK